jgi:hypothetical protein
LSPGFPVTVVVATGREHIARFFSRQIDISEEGVVELLPSRPQLTSSPREKNDHSS